MNSLSCFYYLPEPYVAVNQGVCSAGELGPYYSSPKKEAWCQPVGPAAPIKGGRGSQQQLSWYLFLARPDTGTPQALGRWYEQLKINFPFG